MNLQFNNIILKKFIYGKLRIDFRNGFGRNIGHRGGGHKKNYRIVDFARRYWNVRGFIHALVYDPNRTALLAVVSYTNGILSYILAPSGVLPGSSIFSGFGSRLCSGVVFYLWQIPLTILIHNIELTPASGGKITRAAGTFSKILRKTGKYAVVLLRSGEERIFDLNCLATIGRVSKIQQHLIAIGNAGASRWRGRRPHVRGVAMNPVDHPHGGGQGKTSGGRPSVTPKGKITKGYPTRNKKKASIFIAKFRNKQKANKNSLV